MLPEIGPVSSVDRPPAGAKEAPRTRRSRPDTAPRHWLITGSVRRKDGCRPGKFGEPPARGRYNLQSLGDRWMEVSPQPELSCPFETIVLLGWSVSVSPRAGPPG